jgi:hypothetical protein
VWRMTTPKHALVRAGRAAGVIDAGSLAHASEPTGGTQRPGDLPKRINGGTAQPLAVLTHHGAS